MAENPTIEMVPLGDLQGAKRNAKLHDLEAIKESIQRFGFVAPIIEDARSGRLVAGHGRLEALRSIKEAKGKPPARIVVKGKEWLVPVLRGVAFKDEREAEAYLLADNRLVEIGGWEEEALKQLLGGLAKGPGLIGTGYTDTDLAALTKQLEPRGDGPKPSELRETYEAGVIKQIVLYFDGPQYEDILKRLERIMDSEKLETHTEVILHVLTAYEGR